MRPIVFPHPVRPRTHVRMCMWGGMTSKRGQPEFPTKSFLYALGLLGSATDHMFVMVECPYAGLYCRGFPNILFTLDDRGNISVLFKLIQFHFIVLLN
jgi:hypothetical protein